MRNPVVNRQEIQEVAIAAIENVDMDDIYTIGSMLFELRDYPDLRNRIVKKIVANAQDLGIGDPLEMSEGLQELEASSRPEAVPLYARRIEEGLDQLHLTDYWSAADLLDELLASSVSEARHAGSALAPLIYERCNKNVGELAHFLCVIRDSDPALFQSGIQRLRLLVDGLAACWAWSGVACRSGVSCGGVCTVTGVSGGSPARHLHGYPSMGRGRHGLISTVPGIRD